MCQTCEKNVAAIRRLDLFKRLIKVGCIWDGDTLVGKWEEILSVPPGLDEEVRITLEHYEEGVDYKYIQGDEAAGCYGEICIA